MNKIKTILSYIIFSLCILFIPTTVEAATVKSGSIPCSSGSVSWTLDDAGTLTFSGTGTTDMSDYPYAIYDSRPDWCTYWNKVDVKPEGVKSVKTDSNANIKLDTFKGFFQYFTKTLTSVNISGFDTSNVTDMTDAFLGCSLLTSVDLSGIKTSNVTNMDRMFTGCSSLTSLDLSNFDTSNVTSMGSMFYGCSGLTSLDLSKFNTSKVTYMGSMFSDCKGLKSLDLSKFNTSKVTYMGSMFSGCTGLKSLDLSKFNTSKVTNMNRMFRSCRVLTNLDISNFDTSNVTSMNDMFFLCNELTGLNLSTFNTSKVTDMCGMFQSCRGLTSLDLSNFNTSNVTAMNSMFYGCSGLTSLDLSKFNTSNVTNIGLMFDGCTSLKSLDLSNFDTSNVKSMGSMFDGCESLEYLNISKFSSEETITLPKLESLKTIITPQSAFILPTLSKGYVWIDKDHNTITDTTSSSMEIMISPTVYYITYELEEGINNSSNSTWFTNDLEEITLSEPTKEGHKFLGWYLNSELITNIDTSLKEDITVSAKWECLHIKTILKNYAAPTCCSTGYSGDEICTTCNTQVGTGEVTKATDKHNTTVTGKVEPTCNTEGHTGKTYCTNSNKLLDEGSVIAATGTHKSVVKNAKDATCKEEGYTGDTYCSVCGTKLDTGKAISKLDHSYTSEITKQPTETETGIRTFTCTGCRDSYTEELPMIEKDCEHTNTIIENKKDVTCKNDGYTGDTYCSDCKALISEGSVILKNESHNWMLISTKPATPTEDGEKKYECSICGKEKTETIPKITVTDEPTVNPDTPSVKPTISDYPAIKPKNPSTDEKQNDDSKDGSYDKKQTANKPSKVSSLKLKNVAGKKLNVSFKKQSDCKYQIQVSTDKKFKKSVKKYTSSKTSYTVKKLKKGKTYYVKVRAYKKIDGKTYYGSWSSVKKIKIKK